MVIRIKEKTVYATIFGLVLLLVTGLLLVNASDVLCKEKPISYKIPYIQSGPIIDGEITEGEWAGAECVHLDNETHPSQNVPALVDTDVLMMEDGANFYLAFIAFDPEPDKIRAFFRDRDSAFDDDFVGVVIDTFNDERRAFEFFSNPLGVQMDLIFDDVIEVEDSSWNAIWDSAGKISDKGYVVEMKIPLNQLRFTEGLDKQIWGIDLLRFYQRDKRHRLSNNTYDYNVTCYLCQFKKAQGFSQLEQNVNLQLMPTITTRYSENRPESATDEWQKDFKPDAGIDIRWGITQNFYLNATINPDFSQVEADVAQLDINKTFSLFYPERREFFLDGADYFNTQSRLVHTRNISSPDYGIKLTGKDDVNTYGLFFANDETTNFIIPDNQGSEIASLDNIESLNTAFRYRRDISRNINLGFILTDRHAENYSNTVAGIDGNIRIGKSDRVEMQLIRSYSEYPTQIQADFDQKPEMNDDAYRLNYTHNDDHWQWGVRYTEYGNDFRADMGFINRVDFRRVDLSGGHNWRFGSEKKFHRVYFGGDWEKSYDESGNELEEETWIQISAEGPLQSYIYLGFSQRERFYNDIYFDEYGIYLFGQMKPKAGMVMAIDIHTGDNIDFDNTRLGRMLTIAPRINMLIGKHFQVRLRQHFQKMDISGKRLYSTNLSDLRFTYQFNIRSFLRATVQYSDTKRDQSLYIFDVDSRYKDLTTQLLYSYKVNSHTRFFIGYSDTGFQNDELKKIDKTNRTFFAKFSYAWQY